MPERPADLPTRGGDARQGRGGATRRHLKKISPRVFPLPKTCAYNHQVPSRIHRQACRRGGIGAGCEGETQDLASRVRGKWSPSGETGSFDGFGPARHDLMPDQGAGRACAAHRVVRRTSFAGLSVRDTFRKTGGKRPSGRTTAEGPKSRAKTAERGAERCHLFLNLRGSFRRPVRSMKFSRSPRPYCALSPRVHVTGADRNGRCRGNR
ncbi:hypothetical protein FHW37_12047 [Neorhizobium alkalisoli]|uniref:Uncharacterized protein n=1 Tax=Neorhizobium alkalisoli TaxID=528178 RepID=A0A561PZ79_9HYPH|nr:hypothetical protein FHW37_12047 [Neorhizobium alkalisoli]